MRRLLALLLVGGGLSIVARPAVAQSSIALLPSGVTLRINGPGSKLVGRLYQQSVDSVWLQPRNANLQAEAIAVSQITRVDEARPAYVKSVLLGTAAGILVSAILYPISAHADHPVIIGGTIVAGAVAGLVFPLTDWKPVPLH